MFTDPANGDYTLQELSPCVDAGDPDPMFNDPDSSRSDIGALAAPGPPHVPYGMCPTPLTGDVNNSGSVTSADIIFLVYYVFKGGVAPLPCEGVGDCDCSGSISTVDIIRLVNFMFGTPPAAAVAKGGDPPCDVCPLIIKGIWTCP